MSFREYMNEWIIRCDTRRTCKGCDLYEKHKRNNGAASGCFYSYMLDKYCIIDINKLEQYDIHELELYVRMKCTDIAPNRCYQISCFPCKLNSIENDNDIIIIEREE